MGLAFSIPPVITLDGRALGDASSGDFRVRDIHLSQALYGKTRLDAVLDHPTAMGVPVSIHGPAKAKKDGTLHVKLEGNTKVQGQKVKFLVKQLLDPTSTSLGLTVKLGKTSTLIPIGIVPVVSGDIRISLEGLVDQSAKAGSERTLASDGRLQAEEDWTVEPTLVKKGVSIGSGATILSNLVIGENALVGAGSVVTHDVPDNAIVAGNPARLLRLIREERGLAA